MKPIRTRLARWLAQREERAARQTRRALRNHIRREEIQALAIERRARGLRLYAAWASHTSYQSHPSSGLGIYEGSLA